MAVASAREETTFTLDRRGAPLAVARGAAFSGIHISGVTRVSSEQPILAQARTAMPTFSGKRVFTRTTRTPWRSICYLRAAGAQTARVLPGGKSGKK